MLRLLIFLVFLGFGTAQNPCRVNVIFGIDASNYADQYGEPVVYDELSQIQSAYQSWAISTSSVRAAITRPIGCSQGGSWTLQNDLKSLNSVASSVNRFIYTCFQQFSLSNYIEALNREILTYQQVDQGVNYVFVIFSASRDQDDISQAISLRQKYFDPYGYGVIVVTVGSTYSTNLNDLQTYGVYDLLSDSNLVQDLTRSVCLGGNPSVNTTRAPPPPTTATPTKAPIMTTQRATTVAPSTATPTPTVAPIIPTTTTQAPLKSCPQSFRANVLFELDTTDCSSMTITNESRIVQTTLQQCTLSSSAVEVNLPDPIGLNSTFGMPVGDYEYDQGYIFNTLINFGAGVNNKQCVNQTVIGYTNIFYFLNQFYNATIGNSTYTGYGVPHPIVLFTRTADNVDVADSTTFRQRNLDPHNVKLFVVSINSQATNLTSLASNGVVYSISDPGLVNLLSLNICNTPGLIK